MEKLLESCHVKGEFPVKMSIFKVAALVVSVKSRGGGYVAK